MNMKAERVARGKRDRAGYVAKVILSIVALSGLLAFIVIAPNAIQALTLFEIGKRPYSQQKYYINKTVEKLIKKGYLRKASKNGVKIVELTEKGNIELLRYRAIEVAQKPIEKWDGVWHIIIYDIKEWRKSDREMFRHELQSFGFVMVQNSVWISPFDHENLISLLKADYKFGKDILYIKANYLEGDYGIRKHFGLDNA